MFCSDQGLKSITYEVMSTIDTRLLDEKDILRYIENTQNRNRLILSEMQEIIIKPDDIDIPDGDLGLINFCADKIYGIKGGLLPSCNLSESIRIIKGENKLQNTLLSILELYQEMTLYIGGDVNDYS